MRADAIARRYARALFAIAEEHRLVDAIASALASTDALMADERVARVLGGPGGRHLKQRLLTQVADGMNAPAEFRDFLLLLAEHDRVGHLSAIREVFDQLLDRRRGVTRARVRSAAPLSDEMLADLTRVFDGITGKRVIASVDVDPELIAGVVVEVDGRVYDGSVRTQLDKLHRQMASGV